MKTLIINHEYPPVGGGAGNATKHMAECLVPLGLDVEVVTASFSDLPRIETHLGVTVHRVPAMRSRELESSAIEIGSFTASALFYASRLVARDRPDIVHTFFGLPSGALGYALKSTTGLPYIISFRGRDVHGGKGLDSDGITGAFRTLSRPVWRFADRLIANSDGLRNIARRITPELSIDVIPNGVDANRFTPANPNRNTPLTFLFVGRLEPYKGLDTLLLAVARLKTLIRTPFVLKIVGDGSLRDEIRKQVSELGIAENIEIQGRIAPEHMPSVYQTADVFILPSIVEGMSNGILEAMASGLPVIGTEIPGSEELIANGVNGLLVPPVSIESLAQAMARTAEDSDFRFQAGLEARSSITPRTWESIARRYLSVYEQVLKEKTSCAA